MISPSNFFLTNPEVLDRTIAERGHNLVRGFDYFLEDLRRGQTGEGPSGTENFKPGVNLAIAKGKVVFRNRLIELIQYAPQTETVHPEPVLIVPAWIMKYYILDLSPRNSLVNYLTGQGFTVFMISWKNPGGEDRDIGFDDYRSLGPMAALDAIGAISPGRKVHAVGYCIGGTLLSITAAAMARDNDLRLASITLFAAQTDFTEAGELMAFVDESQLDSLCDLMEEKGYLDTRQMAGAFQMLNPRDLIWSRVVRTYLLGERGKLNDLMAWNADGTRMPARMHTEYLNKLFLKNELVEGKFEAAGAPVALGDIHAPIFAVATVTDHVAPWRSVYKVTLLCDAEVTFALTSGGHNAGIISEPGHPRRHFQISTRVADGKYVDPDAWAKTTSSIEGSWWPAWADWLRARSDDKVPPPPMGAPDQGYEILCDAPGTYVLES
jgi:polyhydroxyalkanoate synthase